MSLNHVTPEQQRRASVNGGLKQRRAKMGYTRAHIIELLQKRGPLIAQEISEFVAKKPNTLLVLLKQMLADEQIIIIGCAGQLTRQIGVKTRNNANVYAVPGTAMLDAPAEVVTPRTASPYREKNLAARREPIHNRTLCRDPFSHMKLAMLARGR